MSTPYTQTQYEAMGATLRRILQCAQIMKADLEWIKADPIANGTALRMDAINLHNALHRYETRLLTHPIAGRKLADEIKSDLNSEEVKDMSLLLDAVQGITNLDAVINAIKIAKEECTIK